MLLYNFKKVLRESNYSGHRFLELIKYLTYKPKYPRNKLELARAEIDWSGNNFLINPKLLLNNRCKYKDIHIVEYIGLASLRNYSDYVVTGNKTLDLLACIGKEDLIKNNRLLRISDGKVYFRYEEAQKEE